MNHSDQPRDAGTKTRRRGPLALLRALCPAWLRRPEPAVRLKGESQALYPGMSGREIRRVALQICRAALGASK